jgi:hypothetical protein
VRRGAFVVALAIGLRRIAGDHRERGTWAIPCWRNTIGSMMSWTLRITQSAFAARIEPQDLCRELRHRPHL